MNDESTGEPQPLSSAPFGELRELTERLVQTVAGAVVGLEREIEHCWIALLAGGHVLLEGPPGVAKTLLVRTLSSVLGGRYGRIQFTPDLMPADVTGTSVFHPSEGEFRFREGPVFANFLLCDEINRAPAKTQAALLEAMQERAVTADGTRLQLPQPFAVFATMNPIEHEGTYPLPEAQLDRFLFKVKVGYPEVDVEARLLAEAHSRAPDAAPEALGVAALTGPERLLAAVESIARVHVRTDLCEYVARLCAATRSDPSLVLGASPRAGVWLLRGAKARAAIAGRDFVTPDDVKQIALPALRHRVVLEPAEEIEGASSDDVLTRILDAVEVPR